MELNTQDRAQRLYDFIAAKRREADEEEKQLKLMEQQLIARRGSTQRLHLLIREMEQLTQLPDEKDEPQTAPPAQGTDGATAAASKRGAK